MSAAANRRGIPFVVAAASGTGKTTICRAVVERDAGIEFSVSHTTRRKRPSERDGVDYHFVDEARFRELVDSGAFLEWARYSGHLYGTSRQAIDGTLAAGRDVLLEIDIQGARQMRDRRDDARLIFFVPPSIEALKQRLRARGTDPEDEIECRLRAAEREFEALRWFDYAVMNDDLERAIENTLEIIRSEREGRRDALADRFAPGAAFERVRGATDGGAPGGIAGPASRRLR